jgi:hypothetical protein
MAIKNSEMVPGRFAKLAHGRRLMSRMNRCWDRGGLVRVGTYTRYTDYKPRHRGMVKLTKTGEIYTQHGKKWLCATGCSFQFTA